jgi:hypothetical protein
MNRLAEISLKRKAIQGETMESKRCNAFPVVKDRPLCLSAFREVRADNHIFRHTLISTWHCGMCLNTSIYGMFHRKADYLTFHLWLVIWDSIWKDLDHIIWHDISFESMLFHMTDWCSSGSSYSIIRHYMTSYASIWQHMTSHESMIWHHMTSYDIICHGMVVY